MKKLILLGAIIITVIICYFYFNNSSDPTSPEKPIIEDPKPEEKTKKDPIDKTPVYGIDISRFQGNEITAITDKDSITFVISKATEGVTYKDPNFNQNWNVSAQKNFIRGAYHFYRSNDDPKQQANNFVRTVKQLNKNDLPPILDIEEGGLIGNIETNTLQKDLLLFLETLESETGRIPIIYTSTSFGNQYLNNEAFSKYPLWVAEYTSNTTPKIPTVWDSNKWSFWQKSDSYKIGSEKNDFDIFNGNKEDLSKFIEAH